MALTDTFDDDGNLTNLLWNPVSSSPSRVGTIAVIDYLRFKDWSGYYNHKVIDSFATGPNGFTYEDFPAFYTCHIYGDKPGLKAPSNSSGWFFPTSYMIDDTRVLASLEMGGNVYATIDDLLKIRFNTIKTHAKYNGDYIELWMYISGSYIRSCG